MRNVEKIIQTIESTLVNVEVKYQEVTKTNGMIFHGLVIKNKSSNVAPVLYLDKYPENVTDEEVAELILDEYQHVKDTDFNIDISKDMSKIQPQLINTDRNRMLLDRCPHIDFLDMSLVFRYIFDKGDDGIASALINYSLAEQLRMDLDELYLYSKRYIDELVISNIFDMLHVEDHDDPELLYVVSTRTQINGAAIIAFPEVVDILAEKFGDFVILPSSVHEVLLMPMTDNMHYDYLIEMVREVNSTLEPSEILSDNVYRYFAETKQWEILD